MTSKIESKFCYSAVTSAGMALDLFVSVMSGWGFLAFFFPIKSIEPGSSQLIKVKMSYVFSWLTVLLEEWFDYRKFITTSSRPYSQSSFSAWNVSWIIFWFFRRLLLERLLYGWLYIFVKLLKSLSYVSSLTLKTACDYITNFIYLFGWNDKWSVSQTGIGILRSKMK